MGNPDPTPYPAGQGPPPPPYQYQGSGPQVTVIQPGVPQPVSQTMIFAGPGCLLTPFPTSIQCPNCNAQVVTNTEFDAGTLTYLAMGGLVLFGCWLGCCLIPLCVNECKDVVHHCPNCHTFVGRYSRF